MVIRTTFKTVSRLE